MGLRFRLIGAFIVVALLPLAILAWSANTIVSALRDRLQAAVEERARPIVEDWLRTAERETQQELERWRNAALASDPPVPLLLGPSGSGREQRRHERLIEALHGLSLSFRIDGAALRRLSPGDPPEGVTLFAWPENERWSDTGDELTTLIRTGRVWGWSPSGDDVSLRAATEVPGVARPGSGFLLFIAERRFSVTEIGEQLSRAIGAGVRLDSVLPGAASPLGDYGIDRQGRLVTSDLGVVTGAPIIAAVSIDMEGVGARQASDLRRALTRLVAIAVFASTLVGLILAQMLSKPLRRLTDAVGRVADGEEPIGPLPGGAGEVGRLASAVDRMLAALGAEHRRRLRAERQGAWQEVARRVAHEVKNPLTPIRLAVDNLRRTQRRDPGQLPSALDAEADAILQEVHRLERLVREFAEFARLPEPRPKAVRLAEIVVPAVRGQVPDSPSISLEVDPSTPADLMVVVDPDLLAMAVANIARNAVQAFGETGGTLRVSVGEQVVPQPDGRSRRFAAVRLEDDGPGIPESLLESIFEPYVSGRGESGSGLGLAVARRIVLDHDGTITAANRPEGGAVFVVRVPLDAFPLEGR